MRLTSQNLPCTQSNDDDDDDDDDDVVDVDKKEEEDFAFGGDSAHLLPLDFQLLEDHKAVVGLRDVHGRRLKQLVRELGRDGGGHGEAALEASKLYTVLACLNSLRDLGSAQLQLILLSLKVLGGSGKPPRLFSLLSCLHFYVSQVSGKPWEAPSSRSDLFPLF